MSVFDEEVEKLIGIEGGYSDHVSDSGGKTKFGITILVARTSGYHGKMVDLPYDTAKAIYKKKYWDTLCLDKLAIISPSVASEVFDTGVNTGVSRAAKFLQRSLNSLNRGGKDYADLLIDGKIGNRTFAALRTFMHKRREVGEVVLLKALNCLQGSYYLNLGDRREKDEDFMFGWLLHRINI